MLGTVQVNYTVNVLKFPTLLACFRLFDLTLRPSQQFFSYVGVVLPGLNQY